MGRACRRRRSRASWRRFARSTVTWSNARSSTQNPADLVSLAAPAAHAAEAAARRTRWRQLLDRIPAAHAARAARPRDVRARLLLRPALRGDREPRRRTRSTSTPRSCACSARARRPASCRSASRPSGRSSATWRGAARRWPRDRREPALFVSQDAAGGSRPRTCGGGLRAWLRHAGLPSDVVAARPAPFVRHPPARGRRRPARHPGAARPRQRLDHPGLHLGRVASAAAPVRAGATRARDVALPA